MRKLNNSTGNVHTLVNDARAALQSFQDSLPDLPNSDQLRTEDDLIQAFKKALLLEESFLKQKSRVTWLKCGDSNNKFFFNACKSRWNQNKILSLTDALGNTHSSHAGVSKVAVDYFSSLLGQSKDVDNFPNDFQLPQLTQEQCDELIRPFTAIEAWNAMKSMPHL